MAAAQSANDAEASLRRLYTLKGITGSVDTAVEDYMMRLFSKITPDIDELIHDLHDELKYDKLRWRLLCTKVYIRMFFDISLKRAILCEAREVHGIETFMLVEHEDLSYLGDQLKRCCLQNTNCRFNDVNKLFVPFRHVLDSVDGWNRQIRSLGSESDLGEVAKTLCLSIKKQFVAIDKLKQLMGSNWHMFLGAFQMPE